MSREEPIVKPLSKKRIILRRCKRLAKEIMKRGKAKTEA
jgi:hypothetical protein